MNKLLSSEYVRKCDYSEKNVTCGSEPTSAKSPLMSVHNMNTFLIPEHIIKCKYSKINTCSVPNNNNNNNNKKYNNNNNNNSKHDNKNYSNNNDDNNGNNDNNNNGNGNNNSKYDANNVDDSHNYDNSNNKEDEIVSFMSITVVKNIFNPVSCYIDPARDVLCDSHVNQDLEGRFSLMNIRIETSQNLNFVKSDLFCFSDDKILEFAQLSEKFQDEYRIHFNPEYIKSEFIVRK